MERCAILFTGGLDSLITARLIARAGFEPLLIFVTLPLHESPARARAGAETLQLPLIEADAGQFFCERLMQPRFACSAAQCAEGGVAPCLDCAIGRLQAAKKTADELGAHWLATGDVVAQRPGGLRSRDFATADHHAGVAERVIRPLLGPLGWPESMRHLAPPEVPTALHGKGRKEQRRLAGELGLPVLEPRPDCPLLSAALAERVRDLKSHQSVVAPEELNLLRMGRQHRLTPHARVIIARNQDEAQMLRSAAVSPQLAARAVLLEPRGRPAPVALAIGTELSQAELTQVASAWLQSSLGDAFLPLLGDPPAKSEPTAGA